MFVKYSYGSYIFHHFHIVKCKIWIWGWEEGGQTPMLVFESVMNDSFWQEVIVFLTFQVNSVEGGEGSLKED